MTRHTRSLRMKRTTAALVAAAVAFVASCAQTENSEEPEGTHLAFGYQVADELRTTNAGSLEGASTMAQALSGSLYPGVYVPGPQGQMIPNTDLVRMQEIPGPVRRVNYTLSDRAVFSDGTPVTCSDYLLAFTAGTNPEIFGSHMPLFDDTAKLTCAPGSKEFTLIFKEGKGARWRGLFEAGTVLPAHAVAKQLQVPLDDLHQDLLSENVSDLQPIAEVWRQGFDLRNFNPELQVSFGPYTVAKVGEQGEVTLRANDFYYGDAPQEPELVVWPGSADSARLAEGGGLIVGDLRDITPDWYDPNAEINRLTVETVIGELTETLTFPEVGTWSSPENRGALSKCVDPRRVAEASSAVSGIEVPVTPLHIVPHGDPMAKRLMGEAEPNLNVDISRASALTGMEVRIAYAYPNERYAAMVESIRQSCEPAGITIIDVTGGGKTLADLPRIEYGEWGQEVWTEGEVDVFLQPINPMREYPASTNRSQEIGLLREQEKTLWQELPSLPLSAQPATFAIDRNVSNVVPYTGLSGIGWNMNRWYLTPSAEAPEESADSK